MRRSKALLLAIVLALACPTGPTGFGGAPVRVLLIGNSYTYFNNLPEMFAQLAAAGQQPAETRMEAPGGWRLKDHWEKGEARKALADGKWDYVVLQDQSTLGVTLFVDGKARVSSDEVFRPAADRWAAEIGRSGAKPVFYLTWARRASPEDQDTLAYAYISAAKASGALVSPVGLAWQRVRRQRPDIGLFADDGSHPSPAGTYLAACTFFAAVFDKDPTGLPASVRGHPVNLDTEKVEVGRTAVLAELPPADARVLQAAAWSAWQELKKKNGGYLDVAKPVVPAVASLPAPANVPAASLAGEWSGTLLIEPSGPTEMTLRLDQGEAGWSGHIELAFKPAEAADVVDVTVTNGEVRFTLPKSAAIADLRVEFRGVSVSPAELRGTAEASRVEGEAPLRLVGSWRLSKR
jgi:hypothetical protein